MHLDRYLIAAALPFWATASYLPPVLQASTVESPCGNRGMSKELGKFVGGHRHHDHNYPSRNIHVGVHMHAAFSSNASSNYASEATMREQFKLLKDACKWSSQPIDAKMITPSGF
jgi:hypothetical protein